MSNRLPAAENVVADRLLRALLEAGWRGLDEPELAAAPALRALPWGGDLVAPALATLERDGRAARVEGRWVAVEATPWVVGTLERLEEGDGLLHEGRRRARRGEEEAFYVRRGRLGGAIDGDVVLAAPTGGRRRGRRQAEAEVKAVLRRRDPQLVGTLEIDEEDRRWLTAYSARTTFEVEVTGAEAVAEGVWVEVRIDRASAAEPHLTAHLVRVLGESTAPGADVEVVLRHYDIPDRFPREVEAAARELPGDPTPLDFAGREDLRHLVTLTIDGESARDFDDALSLEALPGGGARLGVHIADVAHWVLPGSPLDLEAYRRGTSVYFPDRAVPMLPERLSSGLCSLRPGVPRLTVSVLQEFDAEGRPVACRFAESVIESRRRLTYEEVRRLLEEGKPRDALDHGEVLPSLTEMRRLMEILRRRREERGSIDFDLPEGDVVLDTDGEVVGVAPQARNVAHRIVEELMIAANEAVAQRLEEAGVPALYRIHEAPGEAAVAALAEVLEPLGLRLRGDPAGLGPGELQRLLSSVAGSPEGRFVETLVLRSLGRAVYRPECLGHFALASPKYTHFTSPIRRYPDLVVHRALKALAAGGAGSARAAARADLLVERLPAMAAHASRTERRAEQAERDVLQWKKVRFLADRVGERFRGRITGVQPFGLFVQLTELYVDGLVPIRTLGDDFYRFEPESHRLIGDSRGRVFQLADEVEVLLVGVDERHRGLDLEIAGVREPERRGRGPKGRRRPDSR